MAQVIQFPQRQRSHPLVNPFYTPALMLDPEWDADDEESIEIEEARVALAREMER